MISTVSFTVFAIEDEHSGTCGENLTWTLDAEGTLTIEGTGEMTSPSPWEIYRDDITNVIIKDGVTSISSDAFYNHSFLQTITIGSSVTSIGDYAFYYCESLESVNIPEAVTSIGVFAFIDCFSLTEINVHESNAFLSSENGVLFNKDKTLLISYPAGKAETSYTIPSSVETIGSGAFYECITLESIEIPNSVTVIEGQAFALCFSLSSITIPDSVEILDTEAFYYCEALESVTIPKSVTNIGPSAFHGCAALETVIISDGVISIDEYAFEECSAITSITIPNSITSIDKTAFEFCSSLAEINVSENNAAYSSENGVLFNKDKTLLILYPEGKADKKYTIPSSVTDIDDYAFWICSYLEAVDIPDSVTRIGNEAFVACTSLKSISIPDSVKTIGAWAFSECSSLTSVILPSYITSIEDYTFYRCQSLESIIIPDSVTSIGASAFKGCASLESVSISFSVTTINPEAFNDCSALKSVTVPDSVTSIGAWAFGFHNYKKIEGFTVNGMKGSEAEKHAQSKGFTFIELTLTEFPEHEYYVNQQDSTMPNVVANTLVSDLISTLAKYEIPAHVVDKNGNVLADTKYVGTDCKVITDDGEYTVIVKGDVTGDGTVSTVDYLKIKIALSQGEGLEGNCIKAADCDDDGFLSAVDYLKIKSYFLGYYNLYK